MFQPHVRFFQRAADEADVAAVLGQLIFDIARQAGDVGDHLMGHEGIVLRMDDQQRRLNSRQQRQGAAAAIVVDSVAKAVNARGDGVVEFADAPQPVQL